jgi:hypothetical protein
VSKAVDKLTEAMKVAAAGRPVWEVFRTWPKFCGKPA